MSNALRTRAFTLVELLVVVGIIAVLIGILLPVLAGAREQAKSTQCLANLRQIGQAMNMYVVEHKGWVVPAFIRMQPTGPTRGEETWATLLALRYLKGASQLDFIPPQPGEPLPGETAWDNPTSAGNTVFRCPSGVDQKNTGTTPDPKSKTDAINSFFTRKQSTLFVGVGPHRGLGNIIDTWYGCNSIVPTPANLSAERGQDAFPMRTLGHNRSTGRIFGGPLTKATQIRKSAELAMIYDGLGQHDYDTNRISARHGKQKYTNILYADGHAVPAESKSLPDGGAGATQGTSDLRGKQFQKNPFPKWRLDQ